MGNTRLTVAEEPFVFGRDRPALPTNGVHAAYSGPCEPGVTRVGFSATAGTWSPGKRRRSRCLDLLGQQWLAIPGEHGCEQQQD